MLTLLREMIDRIAEHEDPEVEREIIQAQQREVLLLVGRLEAAEQRVREKKQGERPDV